MHKQLELHCKNNEYVSISHQAFSGYWLYGYPVNVSEDFLLMLQSKDFRIDGYILMRTEDVLEVVRNKTEEYFDRIHKQEGVLQLPHPLLTQKLDSWKSIFEVFLQTQVYIGISEVEEAMEFGVVSSCSDFDFNMRCFSTIGEWDDEDTNFLYQDIATVTFYDHYSLTFMKHMKK